MNLALPGMRYLTELRRDLIGEVKRRTKKERLEIPDSEKKPTNDFICFMPFLLWIGEPILQL